MPSGLFTRLYRMLLRHCSCSLSVLPSNFSRNVASGPGILSSCAPLRQGMALSGDPWEPGSWQGPLFLLAATQHVTKIGSWDNDPGSASFYQPHLFFQFEGLLYFSLVSFFSLLIPFFLYSLYPFHQL